METFLECETMCRERSPGHVFVESLAEIDQRKLAEVVRRLSHIRSLQYTAIRSRVLSDLGGSVREVYVRTPIEHYLWVHSQPLHPDSRRPLCAL